MKIFKFLLLIISLPAMAQSSAVEASRFNQEYYQNLNQLNSYQTQSEEESKAFYFKIKTGVSSLEFEDRKVNFNSPIIGGGIDYYLAHNWTVDTGIEQALLTDNTITSIYYAYEININYGLFGNITQNKQVNKTLNYHLINKEKFGGFKVSAGLRQYFLNTVNETMFYSGGAVGFGYQFELFGKHFELAFSNDVISNGKEILTPQKIYLNLLFL